MISIETSIFKSLLYDEEYSRKVYPFLSEEFFDGYQKTLFKTYKDLYDKYNTVPTIEALAVTLGQASIGDSEFEEISELIGEVSESKHDLPNTQWLIDETESYCRDKAIYNAIYSSIAILDGTEKKLDKFVIPDLLASAIAISFDTQLGLDYDEDAAKRFDLYTSVESRIQLPLEALNLLTNGGLIRKCLAAILGGTNVGKTALMCYLAGELKKRGNNVLYITMEMGEEWIGQRIDANILDISTDELKKLKVEEFLSKFQKVKSKTHGRLIIKEYPTGSAHVGHFRHFIKELAQKKKFKPDVIFIDYINICASSRYRTLNGVNSYSYIKAIAEELRGLAVETNSCVFTGTQLTRGGTKNDAPDMTDTSESFGLPATLDWYAAVTTNQVLMDNNQALFHLLKTRWGNKSHIKPQLVGVNYDKMRFSDIAKIDDEVKDKVGQNKPEFAKKEMTSSIEWD